VKEEANRREGLEVFFLKKNEEKGGDKKKNE